MKKYLLLFIIFPFLAYAVDLDLNLDPDQKFDNQVNNRPAIVVPNELNNEAGEFGDEEILDGEVVSEIDNLELVETPSIENIQEVSDQNDILDTREPVLEIQLEEAVVEADQLDSEVNHNQASTEVLNEQVVEKPNVAVVNENIVENTEIQQEQAEAVGQEAGVAAESEGKQEVGQGENN